MAYSQKQLDEFHRRFIHEGEPISPDTNFIIDMLESGKDGYGILKAMISKENFFITKKVSNEIFGVTRDPKFKKIRKKAENFLELCRRSGKIAELSGEASKIKQFLRPYLELLPKKIVADIIYYDKDSFVRRISNKLANPAYIKEQEDNLMARIYDRFERMLKALGIDRRMPDSKKRSWYFDANIVKDYVIGEVNELLKNASNNINAIKFFIENEFKAKGFESDLIIFSSAKAKGQEPSSKDLDMKWLGIFYGLVEQEI